MATLKATLNAGTQSGWMFWMLWMAASFAGGIIYFVPVGVVHILLGLSDSAGPEFPDGFSIPMRVLAAVLCGAACGSTIGLAQWLVLRTRLKRMGGWVAATILGYAAIGLLPLVANILEPGWMDWAFTLIVNGKMHWLARVEPAWPASSWLAGAVTLKMFGLVLGIVQWLSLRGRVAGAGWWIVISTAGWALGAGFSGLPSPTSIFVSSTLPYAIAGAGMVWLLRRPALTDQPSA